MALSISPELSPVLSSPFQGFDFWKKWLRKQDKNKSQDQEGSEEQQVKELTSQIGDETESNGANYPMVNQDADWSLITDPKMAKSELQQTLNYFAQTRDLESSSDKARFFTEISNLMLEGERWKGKARVFIMRRCAAPEAFVIGDGSIFLSQSLIDMCQTVDEIALVLGHELTHLIEGTCALSLNHVLTQGLGWLHEMRSDDYSQVLVQKVKVAFNSLAGTRLFSSFKAMSGKNNRSSVHQPYLARGTQARIKHKKENSSTSGNEYQYKDDFVFKFQGTDEAVPIDFNEKTCSNNREIFTQLVELNNNAGVLLVLKKMSQNDRYHVFHNVFAAGDMRNEKTKWLQEIFKEYFVSLGLSRAETELMLITRYLDGDFPVPNIGHEDVSTFINSSFDLLLENEFFKPITDSAFGSGHFWSKSYSIEQLLKVAQEIFFGNENSKQDTSWEDSFFDFEHLESTIKVALEIRKKCLEIAEKENFEIDSSADVDEVDPQKKFPFFRHFDFKLQKLCIKYFSQFYFDNSQEVPVESVRVLLLRLKEIDFMPSILAWNTYFETELKFENKNRLELEKIVNLVNEVFDIHLSLPAVEIEDNYSIRFPSVLEFNTALDSLSEVNDFQDLYKQLNFVWSKINDLESALSQDASPEERNEITEQYENYLDPFLELIVRLIQKFKEPKITISLVKFGCSAIKVFKDNLNFDFKERSLNFYRAVEDHLSSFSLSELVDLYSNFKTLLVKKAAKENNSADSSNYIHYDSELLLGNESTFRRLIEEKIPQAPENIDQLLTFGQYFILPIGYVLKSGSSNTSFLNRINIFSTTDPIYTVLFTDFQSSILKSLEQKIVVSDIEKWLILVGTYFPDNDKTKALVHEMLMKILTASRVEISLQDKIILYKNHVGKVGYKGLVAICDKITTIDEFKFLKTECSEVIDEVLKGKKNSNQVELASLVDNLLSKFPSYVDIISSINPKDSKGATNAARAWVNYIYISSNEIDESEEILKFSTSQSRNVQSLSDLFNAARNLDETAKILIAIKLMTDQNGLLTSDSEKEKFFSALIQAIELEDTFVIKALEAFMKKGDESLVALYLSGLVGPQLFSGFTVENIGKKSLGKMWFHGVRLEKMPWFDKLFSTFRASTDQISNFKIDVVALRSVVSENSTVFKEVETQISNFKSVINGLEDQFISKQFKSEDQHESTKFYHKLISALEKGGALFVRSLQLLSQLETFSPEVARRLNQTLDQAEKMDSYDFLNNLKLYTEQNPDFSEWVNENLVSLDGVIGGGSLYTTFKVSIWNDDKTEQIPAVLKLLKPNAKADLEDGKQAINTVIEELLKTGNKKDKERALLTRDITEQAFAWCIDDIKDPNYFENEKILASTVTSFNKNREQSGSPGRIVLSENYFVSSFAICESRLTGRTVNAVIHDKTIPQQVRIENQKLYQDFVSYQYHQHQYLPDQESFYIHADPHWGNYQVMDDSIPTLGMMDRRLGQLVSKEVIETFQLLDDERYSEFLEEFVSLTFDIYEANKEKDKISPNMERGKADTKRVESFLRAIKTKIFFKSIRDVFSKTDSSIGVFQLLLKEFRKEGIILSYNWYLLLRGPIASKKPPTPV